MATRKWLENWLVWIAVDVVYVGDVRLAEASTLTSALYAVFLVLAVRGHARVARVDARRTGVALQRDDGVSAPARRADRPRVHGQDVAGTATWPRTTACPRRPSTRASTSSGTAPRSRYADVEPIGRGPEGRRGRGDRAGRGRGRALRAARHRPRQHDGLQPPLLRRLPGVGRGGRPRAGSATSTCCTTSTSSGRPTATSARQPERREELFVRFKLTLEVLDAPGGDDRGDWAERRRARDRGDRRAARRAAGPGGAGVERLRLAASPLEVP